jgi:photoactive yellow protein
LTFDEAGLLAALDAATPDELDSAPFGIVSMDRSGLVTHYNATEARLAGINRERVVGLNFFTDVGQCTNNYLVAGRYDGSDALDEFVDFVFTFRMKPTPVRLRLLRGAGSDRQYLVVHRR